MILVDIENEELETRNKKGGGTYQVQAAYIHTVDRAGRPERYPRQVSVFPPRDDHNGAVPYKVGSYTISDASIVVENGFIALGFVSLTPVKKPS